MSVLIAPQFFSSMAQLTGQEQSQVTNFINTFQSNPTHTGINLHPVQNAKGLWSGRVNRDLRTILHKDGATWAILYVDHHDDAYRWAERRDIGRHPVTGALQIVESVEVVREVERIIEIHVEPEQTPLFAEHNDTYLLSLGLPESWLPALRKVRKEEQLLIISDKLPAEVSERLLDLADGQFVTPPVPVTPEQPVESAPDTQERFYVAESAEDLETALKAPMDRWIAFLHPSQKEMVTRQYNGPSKVSGSAGTGKTVVAMHRARYLARKGETVLLTSYVSTLCENLERNLSKLCSVDEKEQITTSTVHRQALAIIRTVEPQAQPTSDDDVRSLLDTLHIRNAPEYDIKFIMAEWDAVVRNQGIATWAEYRRARRTGRGSGLSVKERKKLWRVFGGALESLANHKKYDWAGLCTYAKQLLEEGKAESPFTAVIVDELQDLRPPELRFLKQLCVNNPENLMLCGDAGQRIYPGGFSLRGLGINVVGRSKVLRINYRTTEQIRRMADRMLGGECDDMDGGKEKRNRTRSLLAGPQPLFQEYRSLDDERDAGVAQVQKWLQQGLRPEAIGIFARTSGRINDFGNALSAEAIPFRRLSDKDTTEEEAVQLGTMHRAKGLEFKAVLVLDCRAKVLPSPGALRGLDDPQDREAALDREQRLLYVAMTRARDELVISWSEKPTIFLIPLLTKSKETVV
ncbi:MAG: ATP-dependent helicase [Deltaproteobacteria bacterium]|nr:MAG: ATP-dependent helicase [Deltaproteobacteria bacterium]